MTIPLGDLVPGDEFLLDEVTMNAPSGRYRMGGKTSSEGSLVQVFRKSILEFYLPIDTQITPVCDEDMP